MKAVVIDIETGGLTFDKAIIQIAAAGIEFSDLTVIETFEVKIKFRIENADPEALRLNSYDAKAWESKAIPPGQAADQLSGFFNKYSDVHVASAKGNKYHVAQLIGHNADRFDGPFLRAWFERLGIFMPATISAWDTCQKLRWFYAENADFDPPQNYKLGTLAQHLGIEQRESHDAMSDVITTIEILRRIRALKRND